MWWAVPILCIILHVPLAPTAPMVKPTVTFASSEYRIPIGRNEEVTFSCSVESPGNVPINGTNFGEPVIHLWCGCGSASCTKRCGGDCRIYDSLGRWTSVDCEHDYFRGRLIVRWRVHVFRREIAGQWGCEYNGIKSMKTIHAEDNEDVINLFASPATTVRSGIEVVIVCAFVGIPGERPNLVWKVPDAVSVKDSAVYTEATSVLVLRNVTYLHSGTYSCGIKYKTPLLLELKVVDDLAVRPRGCTACELLEKCTRLRCNLVADNGLFYYPLGCVAKCPHGLTNLECQDTPTHPKWYPDDPCFKKFKVSAEGTVALDVEKVPFPIATYIKATAIYLIFLLLVALVLLSPTVNAICSKCWRKIRRKKKPLLRKLRKSVRAVVRTSKSRKSKKKDQRLSVFTIDEVQTGKVKQLDVDPLYDTEVEEEDDENICTRCFGNIKGPEQRHASKISRRVSIADAQLLADEQQIDFDQLPEDEQPEERKENIFTKCFGKKKEPEESHASMISRRMSIADAQLLEEQQMEAVMDTGEEPPPEAEDETKERKSGKKIKDKKKKKKKDKEGEGAENEPPDEAA